MVASNNEAAKTIPVLRNTRLRTLQNAGQRQSQVQEAVPVAATEAGASQTTNNDDSQFVQPPNENRRNTRPQNKFRRPALDVGLDWQDSQREREDAAAAKSERKAELERKKAEKVERIHLRHTGINRIAALEEAREQRDREEDANLNPTGTACTYIASFNSQEAPLIPGADNVGSDEGSQYVAGGLGEDDLSSESARSENDDDHEPAARQPKKVRTMLLHRSQVFSNGLCQSKTKAQLKHERQKRVHGEIEAARQKPQAGGHSAGRPSKTAPTIAANIPHDPQEMP